MAVEKLVINQACKEKFAPVVEEINKLIKVNDGSPILVAIDGMCASGKTTLGYYLRSIFKCNLFHMDDFFLQKHQRTQERLEDAGGNVDYERFKTEVLEPIIKKQNVIYRPYRCDVQKLQDGKNISFKLLNIIEGSYSQHPYFGEIFDLKIFISIPESTQIERIKERNGEAMLQKFIDEWIPMENKYFKKYKVNNNGMLIKN